MEKHDTMQSGAYDTAGDDNANGVLQTATYYYPTQTNTRNDGKKTQFSYTFWDGNDRQIKTKTTTLPSIGSGQNGSGTATSSVEFFDECGRLRWTKDGEGYIRYRAHHPLTGEVA